MMFSNSFQARQAPIPTPVSSTRVIRSPLRILKALTISSMLLSERSISFTPTPIQSIPSLRMAHTGNFLRSANIVALASLREDQSSLPERMSETQEQLEDESAKSLFLESFDFATVAMQYRAACSLAPNIVFSHKIPGQANGVFLETNTDTLFASYKPKYVLIFSKSALLELAQDKGLTSLINENSLSHFEKNLENKLPEHLSRNVHEIILTFLPITV